MKSTMDTSNKRKPIIGFTTSRGLILDLDSTTLKEAKWIADKYCRRFKLQGYLIMRSSTFNYHVIFNRPLRWPSVIEMLFKIAWYYHYHKHGVKPRLMNWAILQAIKHSCTLRIGPKGRKKPPKAAFQYGKNDKLIRDYLQFFQEQNRGD